MENTNKSDLKGLADLRKNLKKDFSHSKLVKLAVVGDSATQLFVEALKGYGYEVGINFDIFEAEYDQIEQQILDTSSPLYQFKPEFIVLFHSTQKATSVFYGLSDAEKQKFADGLIKKIKNYYDVIKARSASKIICMNYAEINDAVFGNYANKLDISLLYQLRKYNYELMNLSRALTDLYVSDVNSLQSHYGRDFVTDDKIYITADMVFSIDFLPVIAKNTADIIRVALGMEKKCLILDLDNVLWGGIIGDDGLENIHVGDLGIGKAFTQIQQWVKQLRQRGIIIAVCSKNDEKNAKEPFEKHPDMVLHLDDIALFVANWNNKADNIKYIQKTLNIGFDSMVFLDDSPFERNMVRACIPGITVPELPQDPAEYLSYLKKLNVFEAVSYTEEDTQRTQQYQEESKRVITRQSFEDENAFLATLEMKCTVKPFDAFHIPRIAQLTQRTNQFNLRTIRYTQDELNKIAASGDYFCLSFSLQDKYGDYGLICVVILQKRERKKLSIDTWLMSCRVLSKGVEQFVLNTIVDVARKNGVETILGEYIPTPKNGMVKDHYLKLGFSKEGERWTLGVSAYRPKDTFITSQ